MKFKFFAFYLSILGLVAISGCDREDNQPSQRYCYVTFDSNGGVGSMSDQKIIYGESQNLKMNEFTREGCSFLYWTDERDQGVIYRDGENVTLYSDLTLYARWQSDGSGNNGGNNGGDNGGNNGGDNGGNNGGDNGGGGPSVPSAPTGLRASFSTLDSDKWVYVGWNSVYNATSYKIYKSTSANGTYSQIGTSDFEGYADHNLRIGDNYYKVRAVNSAGMSDYSDYVNYYYGGSTPVTYSPCPVHYTSHTATSTTISLRWTIPSSTGCGTPTTAYLRVKHPDNNNYADLQTLSGTATSASFTYPAWANSEGYVYCGIITENSSGTSGGTPLVYNVNTGTWYGGNGKSINELNLNEEFMNFEK